MSRKPYRGASGKTVWENRNFQNGVNYNDDPLNEGHVRALCNFDLNRNRGTLHAREPFYSAAFKQAGESLPHGLNKDTLLFKSVQDVHKEFLINIGSERPTYEAMPIDYNNNIYKGPPSSEYEHDSIRVIDGDTIAWKDYRFRLLGIDAPEMDDAIESPTQDSEKGELAQQELYDILNSAEAVHVVYDRMSDSALDKYERHLVWVYYQYNGSWLNVNTELLANYSNNGVVLMGAYDDGDTLHTPNYKGIEGSDYSFDFESVVSSVPSGVKKNKTVVFYDNVPKTINVYNKNVHTNLNGFSEQGKVKIPVIELENILGQVDTSQIYEDLDIPYGVPVRFEVNNIIEENKEHYMEYKPWTRLDDIDGIVFLGTVYREEEEIYKGIISVKYFIPLKDNMPLYDSAVFKVETYKDNVFNVKFEELNNRYNLNLLDPTIPYRRDFIGEDVEEHNYYTYLLPGIGILDEDQNYVSQLAQGKHYTLRPYYVLPELHEAEQYDGYAVKFEFYTSEEYFQDKIFQAYSSRANFPDRGRAGVIYIATSQDNQHYAWSGDNYIQRDAPQPIRSTGWGMAFNKQGNVMTDYKSYRVYDTSDIYDQGLVEKQKITTDTYNDQEKPVINSSMFYHPQGSYQVFNTSLFSAGQTPFIIYLNTSPNYDLVMEKIYQEDSQLPAMEFYDENENLLGSISLEDLGLNGTQYTREQEHIIDPFVDPGDLFLNNGINPNHIHYVKLVGITVGTGIHDEEIHIYFHRYLTNSLYADGGEYENPTNEYDDEVMTINDMQITTDDPLFKEAKADSQGNLYVIVRLSPVTIDGPYFQQSDLELDTMSRTQSLVARIRDQEELEVQYQHGQDLHECTSITSYKGQLVLYGSPKAPTVIYMSDEGGNITYFPFRRALDQFTSDIIHVEPVKQGLIVFTSTDVYMVHEVIDEHDQIHFMASIVQSNLSLRPHNRNTVRPTGRDILFMSEGRLLLLRPNPYVEDITDMFLEDISLGMKELIEDPITYAQERVKYFGDHIDLNELENKIEYYSIVKNDAIWLMISIDIPGHDPFMIIGVYSREQRPHYWKIYDTRAMAFPYNHAVHNAVEGHHILMRNDRLVNGGVTMMLNEALNLWDFAEDYGKLFDIKTLRLDNSGTQFIYNSVDLPTFEEYQEDEDYQKIKQPIRATIDTGYMNIAPQLMKRFHKFYIEIHNIDAQEIPLYMNFSVDGITKQTSKHTQLVTDEEGMMHYRYDFNSVLLDLWELDFSMFTDINRFRIDLGVSGRGRLPRMVMVFKTTGKFKVYGYGIIFKDQTAR